MHGDGEEGMLKCAPGHTALLLYKQWQGFYTEIVSLTPVVPQRDSESS